MIEVAPVPIIATTNRMDTLILRLCVVVKPTCLFLLWNNPGDG